MHKPAIKENEIFSPRLEREHADETLTFEEAERAEEAWQEYLAGEGTPLSVAVVGIGPRGDVYK